jgi:hypothetical protein
MVALDGFDLSAQTRAQIDAGAVGDYAALLKAGQPLDPGLAFKAGDGQPILACGYHRRLAYKQAGKTEMPVEIREGGHLDAIRAGIEDNRKHCGVRFTQADMRRAVEMLLQEAPEMSDRKVAELVDVTHPTVAKVRADLEARGKIYHVEARIGRDGHSYSVPPPKRAPVKNVAQSKQPTATKAASDTTPVHPEDTATDAATAMPEPPHTPAKSIADRFTPIFDALQVVKNHVYDLGLEHPGSHYGTMSKQLTEAWDTLMAWEAESREHCSN